MWWQYLKAITVVKNKINRREPSEFHFVDSIEEWNERQTDGPSQRLGGLVGSCLIRYGGKRQDVRLLDIDVMKAVVNEKPSAESSPIGTLGKRPKCTCWSWPYLA